MMSHAETCLSRAASSRPEVSETLRVPFLMLTQLLKVVSPLRRKKVAKGQMLYRQGEISDRVYVVVSGRIGIAMVRPHGLEFLIDIVGAGALCGEGAAFDGLPRFSSASALEPSEVMEIAAAEFCSLMSSDAAL